MVNSIASRTPGQPAVPPRPADHTFLAPDGKRYFVPAVFYGVTSGLRRVSGERHVDPLGNKWLVSRWMVATEPGLPQRYTWSINQAHDDWSPMPERFLFKPQPTPEGQPKRYIAEGKRYIVDAYPMLSGGVFQVARAADANWRPVR